MCGGMPGWANHVNPRLDPGGVGPKSRTNGGHIVRGVLRRFFYSLGSIIKLDLANQPISTKFKSSTIYDRWGASMAGWGGKRVGAGRKPRREPIVPAELTPLQYLRAVLDDESASPSRRDRAAITLARYTEMPVAPLGKKQMLMRAAQSAGADTEWGDDLRFRGDDPLNDTL